MGVAVVDNAGVFDQPAVAATYSSVTPWLAGDIGEKVALMALAPQVRGVPLLDVDVGVGGGRTTWFLLLLSSDYVGVDFAPTMVAICRANYPGVDIRLGDARDLRELADDSFGFVTFSNNGLDAVGHDDRARALGELTRVLRPGGLLMYSTHNRYGSSYDERPWQLSRPHQPITLSPRAMARFALRSLSRPSRAAAPLRGYLRNRSFRDVHEEWAIGPLAAHGYAIVAHFASMRWVAQEVAAQGLELERLLTVGGDDVDLAGQETHAHYFHVLARKPARPS